VTDLTAADFKIVDQGKPETILAFEKPAADPAPLAALEYTNRPGGTMPHATVILFDMINMNQADRLDTWKEFDKSIPQLESGEDVYFYVLNLEGVPFTDSARSRRTIRRGPRTRPGRWTK
jgi:hypothetical protein